MASGDIEFYLKSGENGWLSNFAPYPIRLKGRIWPTSEDYYQAQKFAGEPDEEEIRAASGPARAARMGRDPRRPAREDWEAVKDDAMREALHAKFTQHPELRARLLATGDARLVEHTGLDSYWGDGGDGSGSNRLGTLLVELRGRLRAEPEARVDPVEDRDPAPRKRLAIGDIHGCHAELLDLLDAVGLSSGDEIIALGDIVDRGPDTPRVVEFFRRTPGARSLLGNHERKHIRSSRGLVRPAISQTIAKAQLGDAYPAAVAFLETFPPWIELDEAILAHGFWEPGVPLSSQRETVLAGVMTGEAYLERRHSRPWHQLYDGPKPIVVGHRDYLRTGRPLVVGDRVFGIDTDCVRGGRLTGLLLPEFRLVSVPSRGDHWARVCAEHRRRSASRPPVTWSAEDDAVASRIVDRVSGRHAAILDELRREAGWDGLSPAEQARAYAARVEGLPARAWLFAARKGRLAPEDVRRRLQTPVAARRCLETLGPDLGDPA